MKVKESLEGQRHMRKPGRASQRDSECIYGSRTIENRGKGQLRGSVHPNHQNQTEQREEEERQIR